MNRHNDLEQRIEVIQCILHITATDAKEIDTAIENWMFNKLNAKLKEKGWLENEK